MRQIDKDIFALSGIAVLLESTGRNIKDCIDEYDGVKVMNLIENSEIYKKDINAEKAIKEFANELYKRIKKKFPKET